MEYITNLILPLRGVRAEHIGAYGYVQPCGIPPPEAAQDQRPDSQPPRGQGSVLSRGGQRAEPPAA